MNIQQHQQQKKKQQNQVMLSPQQLSLLNKNKLIEMVYKNYQNQATLVQNQGRPAETGGCVTVLSASSNNETIEENNLSFAVNSQQSKNNNSKNQSKIILSKMSDTKSAQITRRSQSGDGSKSLNNRDKLKNLAKISKDPIKHQLQQQQQQDRASYISFFNNSKEIEFLTKTIGVAPNITNAKKTTSNAKSKNIAKKKLTNTGEKYYSNSKVDRSSGIILQTENGIVNTQGSIGNTQLIFKSFQNNPNQAQSTLSGPVTKKNDKIRQDHLTLMKASSGEQQHQLQNQKFMKSLKQFTQNYFGVQQEKKKKRLTNNKPASSQKKSQLTTRRDKSESFITNTNHDNTQSQLKFGQIMEELERFSLSNQNLNQFNLTEDSIAQSSVMESELEYTDFGNIRASTYKRNAETVQRRQQQYKSEDRKIENGFFSQEYLESRYMNPRVEMELSEFKKEIEGKFQKSDLRDYKFSRGVTSMSYNMQSDITKTSIQKNQSVLENNGKKSTMKAMFQNFMKQSFDNQLYKTKLDTSNNLLTCQDRFDQDFNSLTQLTFDVNQPRIKTNYNGVSKKTSKTVIKDQSQVVGGAIKQNSHIYDKQQKQQKTSSQYKTPKNYSLQLNQVVKKILTDNRGGAGLNDDNITTGFGIVGSSGTGTIANNYADLGTINEPCFYTTYNNNSGKQKNFGSQIEFMTKDCRYNSNNAVDAVQHTRYSRSNSSSRGGTRSKKRDNSKQKDNSTKKRVDSTVPAKNSLINKFFRQSKAMHSPQSRQPKIKTALKDGNQMDVRFSKPTTQNTSAVNSNLSTNRFLHMFNKPFSQQRRQASSSIKTTAKSTQKNSRMPSSSKKPSQQNTSSTNNQAVNISSFQTQGTNVRLPAGRQQYTSQDYLTSSQNVISTSNDQKLNQLLLKNSQIKRSAEGLKQSDNYKNQLSNAATSLKTKSQKQEMKTLMQRSFHHNSNNAQSTYQQPKSQNLKGSIHQSPTQLTGLQKSIQKSTQKIATSNDRIINLGQVNVNSNNSSKAHLNKSSNMKQTSAISKSIALSKICSAERVNTAESHPIRGIQLQLI